MRCGVLLAIGAIATLAGSASAQGLPEATPTFNPDSLPAYRGTVQLFTLTPRGDIDGMVLADGTEVKTPPHLSAALARIVRPGSTVTIHGLKAARLPLLQAVSVTDDASGQSIVDRGPEGGSNALTGSMAADHPVSGRVRMALHGLRGEVNGVLLDDGTVLKLPPSEAERFRSMLRPGQTVAAEGTLRVTVAGRVVDVTALGLSPDQLQPFE